jgi:DNA-binding NarL/FixJ family response regulator
MTTTTNPIRLLIAEDDISVREGFISMLESVDGFEVVAEAECATSAISLSLEHRPDVILMDLGMPAIGSDLGGLEAVEQIRQNWAEAKILVLSNHKSSERIYRAIRLGASGYILKLCSFEEIQKAIHSVYQGTCYMAPEVLNKLTERIYQDGTDQLLSAKEIEVIRIASKGFEAEEVASRMNISLSSVKIHWGNIISKLKAKNKVQAIDIARERGFF